MKKWKIFIDKMKPINYIWMFKERGWFPWFVQLLKMVLLVPSWAPRVVYLMEDPATQSLKNVKVAIEAKNSALENIVFPLLIPPKNGNWETVTSPLILKQPRSKPPLKSIRWKPPNEVLDKVEFRNLKPSVTWAFLSPDQEGSHRTGNSSLKP